MSYIDYLGELVKKSHMLGLEMRQYFRDRLLDI